MCAENYVFSYNRERAQPLGLLKATPGKSSNLLVITTDGKVYSYIIKYAAAITEMNRFVTHTESIGHEHQRQAPIVLDSLVSVPKKEVVKKYSNDFLEKSCSSLLKRPERKSITKHKKGISLGIKNRVYY